MTSGVAVDIYLKFVVILFGFGRSVTLLSPKNLPGTHQYAVTLVAQIVAQILGVLLKQNLLDKVSWHMNLFPVLPNEYYTFVTSPCLSSSPSEIHGFWGIFLIFLGIF